MATGAFRELADAIVAASIKPYVEDHRMDGLRYAMMFDRINKLARSGPMVFEVCVVKVDDHGNHKHVVMAPTAVVAKDENAAIVAATRKLEEGVDTNTIEVLVRPFR